MIPVMGKGNIAKWWRLFTAYGIPVYITFDNDSDSDEKASHRTDLLQTLGVDEGEATEAIETQDWLIQATYCVFGRDFEQCMRAAFHDDYERLENEVRESFGHSKHIIARYVAEQLPDRGDGWARVRELGERIKAMVASTGERDSSEPSSTAEEPHVEDFWEEDDEIPF